MKGERLRLVLCLIVLLWSNAYGQPTAIANALSAPRSWTGGYLGIKDNGRKSVIVFVHGVLGDFKESWTNQNGTYWPQLVAQDLVFKDSNVYVHRYVSPKLETAQDIEELATRLGDFLHKDGVVRDHDRIIFVCHSMGGLVARAFLVQSRLPAKKVPLMYFFGTPTAGANPASLAYLVSKNPQFQNMVPFVPGSYVEALAKKWLATSEDPSTGYPRKLWSYCAYEKKEYFGKIVVDQLSATYLCNAQPRSLLSDHVEMVKPESSESDAHAYLTRAYQLAASAAGQEMLAALYSPTPMTGTIFLPGVRSGASEKVRYRTQMIDAGTIQVPCNEAKQGERAVAWTPFRNENMFAAHATVDTSPGLPHSEVMVSSWSRNQIAYWYDLKGRSTQQGNCGTEGMVNVLIKYLTIEKD